MEKMINLLQMHIIIQDKFISNKENLTKLKHFTKKH